MATIVLEIPDVEVIKGGKWTPEGVFHVRIKQDPAVTFESEVVIFVKKEWIKEIRE